MKSSKDFGERVVYVPQLRKEKEKAALCMKKLRYANKVTYFGFVMLWHERWASDFKDCERRNIKKQVQRGRLDEDVHAKWWMRYQYYFDMFGKANQKELDRIIKSCRESKSFPDTVRKRLRECGLSIQMAETKKKLGGYQLFSQYKDDTGRKRKKIVAGRKFDLSQDDVLAILEKLELAKEQEQCA